MNIVVAVGGLCLSLITMLTGFVVWYTNSEKRKYGLERDFNHLKRNQESIQQGIEAILKEIDRRFDSVERDILEIKAESRISHEHNYLK